MCNMCIFKYSNEVFESIDIPRFHIFVFWCSSVSKFQSYYCLCMSLNFADVHLGSTVASGSLLTRPFSFHVFCCHACLIFIIMISYEEFFWFHLISFGQTRYLFQEIKQVYAKLSRNWRPLQRFSLYANSSINIRQVYREWKKFGKTCDGALEWWYAKLWTNVWRHHEQQWVRERERASEGEKRVKETDKRWIAFSGE